MTVGLVRSADASRLQGTVLIDIVTHTASSQVYVIPERAFSTTEPAAWFYSEQWQDRHRQALADLAAGDVEEFETMEEFLDGLDL